MSEQPIKLFISHASEDKEAFAKGLADALNANPKFEVWYDDYSLRLGDSLVQSIAKGLHSCDYGIVVLSPAFFAKKWPANELAGLFALETKERKIILPIWHNVTYEQVLEFNAILADRKAIPSTQSPEEIVFAIEFATGVSQRVKELANPYHRQLIAEIRDKMLTRQANDQLGNSFEGAKLVKASVISIFDRFEQLVTENQDSLSIQIQRQEAPTHSIPYSSIMALGPSNANVQIGYRTKNANRVVEAKLVISMFAWDHNFHSVLGKRKERSQLVYNPSFTIHREVVWTQEDDTAKARWTSEAIAQQAITWLLQFILERVQGLDTPDSYHPPEML